MSCIAVTTTNPASKLGEAGLIVDTLERINIGDFNDLILENTRTRKREIKWT